VEKDSSFYPEEQKRIQKIRAAMNEGQIDEDEINLISRNLLFFEIPLREVIRNNT